MEYRANSSPQRSTLWNGQLQYFQNFLCLVFFFFLCRQIIILLVLRQFKSACNGLIEINGLSLSSGVSVLILLVIIIKEQLGLTSKALARQFQGVSLIVRLQQTRVASGLRIHYGWPVWWCWGQSKQTIQQDGNIFSYLTEVINLFSNSFCYK